MALTDTMDPKGLIREAYRIEGITAPECRSIFLDWALSLGEGEGRSDAETMRDAIETLLARYEGAPSDHPMTQTLREGLQTPPEPRRRGGRRARVQ